MFQKPLAIDLFCGLGGWAEGFLSEGYDVIGFDIERRPYPAELVLQDVLTLHGRQFSQAAIIVASPPCQEYSYRAMPWKRARSLPPPDNSLFESCFLIQRQASIAANRFIPLIVENVKGAQKWVGRARWHFGSYYLWGDVPALMPAETSRKVENAAGGNVPKGTGKTSWFFGNTKHELRNGLLLPDGSFGIKQHGSGPEWFDKGIAKFGSRSEARKHASAAIAKIPFPLARHIAAVYKP